MLRQVMAASENTQMVLASVVVEPHLFDMLGMIARS
jgi:hypothetical protein